MKDQIRQHIKARLDATDVSLYPFPHLLVENFWPDEVYKNFHAHDPLIENNDLARPWLKKHNSNNPHYQIRKQIDLYKLMEYPSSEHIDFWRTIHDVLFEDNWYLDQIHQKNQTYFATLYGPMCKENTWYNHVVQEWFVQKHDVGYFIGPHTDRLDRVFTNIWTFAKDDDHHELGTSLYVPQDGDISHGGRHFGFEGFTKVKQMPFAPNCLFVFFKSRFAFHAVDKINKVDETKRYGMQIQVYEKPMREITKDVTDYKTLLDD